MNTIHGPDFPLPPPDLINGEEEYEIKKILCHCGTLTTHSFLIQWKGYLAKEDPRVPKQNLKHAKFTLTAYKRLHPTAFTSSPLTITSPLSCPPMLSQFLLCPLSLRFYFFLLASLLLPLPDQMLVGEYLEARVGDLQMFITCLLLLLLKWNLHLFPQ